MMKQDETINDFLEICERIKFVCAVWLICWLPKPAYMSRLRIENLTQVQTSEEMHWEHGRNT